MAITATSNPRGIIPSVGSHLGGMLREGYQILKIEFKMIAKSLKEQQGEGKRVCCHIIEWKREEKFFASFNKNSYLEGLAGYLRQRAVDLQKINSYIDLKVKLTIVGFSNDKICDKKVQISMRGNSNSSEFNKDLLTTQASNTALIGKLESKRGTI